MSDAQNTVIKLIESGEFNKLPPDTQKLLLKQLGITPPPTVLDKVKNLYTGEGKREFDYPDFNSALLYPGANSADMSPLGMTKKRLTGQHMDMREAAYNSAVTDDVRMDILNNYRPDIGSTVKYDKYGVPYVSLGKENFYLNRPGMSVQDIREGAATALAVLPFAKGASKAMTTGPVISRSAATAAVGAAGSVAQDMLAEQGGSKAGISGERALVSGGLSLATMLAWPIIRAIGVKPFQALFSKPQLVNGEFTTEAIEVFRKAGIDPRVFDDVQKAEVARLLSEATDPTAMASILEAKNMKNPVSLTKGQATGDRSQQALEYQMREGLLGDTAKQRMAEFDDAARSAHANNIQDMRTRVIGAVPENEYNLGVGRAQNELYQDRVAALNKYKQLYKDVENFSDQQLAWVETPERFRQTLLNNVDVKENLQYSKRLKDTMDDFEFNVMRLDKGPGAGTTGSHAPSVNEMFNWRKRLQARINTAPPEEQRLLVGVKREFDTFMKDTVADGLVRGDPALIDMWKEAIKSRAEYGKLFQGDDIVDRITALTKNGAELAVTPHEAANLIFGASDAGFISKWNIVKNVELLKKRLTPESWNGLKGDFVIRMLGLSRDQLEAVAAGSAQLPSGAAFKAALSNFRTKNSALYKVLFSDEDSKLMSSVANVWHKLTVPRQGANNPSGSGLWVGQQVARTLSGPIGTALKEILALMNPAAKMIIKPIKGSMKAGSATGYGGGYSPEMKMLAPPPALVSPTAGNLEQRLLDKYNSQ